MAQTKLNEILKDKIQHNNNMLLEDSLHVSIYILVLLHEQMKTMQVSTGFEDRGRFCNYATCSGCHLPALMETYSIRHLLYQTTKVSIAFQ